MSSSKAKTESIRAFFSMALEGNEAAFMYLGYSGVLLRIKGAVVAFDPANLITDEEIRALKSLNLLLFTHGHGDHYKSKETLELFQATGTNILAENSVFTDLRGKVPENKLTLAEPGKSYRIGGVEVAVISGVHRGPINLYQVRIGEFSVFHGGDSGYVPVKGYPSNLVFLPTGTPSPTASPSDAFKMASELKPNVVVAIHGSEPQSKEFEKRVREKMPTVAAFIAVPYEPRKVALR